MVGLAGVEMPLLTGEARFFSGVLEVDAQALYMFCVMAGCAIALALRPAAAARTAARIPAWLVLLGFAALSLTWTPSAVYGLRMLVKLATPALFLATCLVAIDEGLPPAQLIRAAIGAALIALALALLNFVTRGALSPLIPVEGLFGLPQLSAPYSSPSNFAFLMAAAAFAAYGCFLRSRKAGFVIVALSCGVAILFALNRAALGSLAVGFLGFHLARARLRPAYLLAGLLALALIAGSLMLSPAFKKRMFYDADDIPWSTLLTDSGAFLTHLDTSGRNDLWLQANESFAGTSAWFGGGIGSVDRWIRDRDVRGVELHSDLYRLYLDLGLLGLACYCVAIAALVVALGRVARTAGSTGEAIGARIGVAALVGYFATLPTDNSLNYVAQFGVVAYALVAAGLARTAAVPAVVSGAPLVPAAVRYANVAR
ncbi:MAG: hypothetical protein JSR73_11500 [Proteobacteria bacterium]|nr:hypothetical protein [Pseudomonadota bacterium]